MRAFRFLLPLTITLVLAAPAVALAWGNGPARGAGFGTHDWILVAGNRMANGQGIGWLDVAVATSATAIPDSLRGDQPNHYYDRWGKQYGRAQARVKALYAQAVTAYRAGDRREASRLVGMISHYYGDVCDPLHTDNAKAEPKMRGRFERAVDSVLRTPGSASSWAKYDGYVRVVDSSALTVGAAKLAHRSYSALVRQYNRRGCDPTVVKIARQSVCRAANGVADLIMSIQQDAVETSNSPGVYAHQGIAAGGGFYYLFQTTTILRYDRSWNASGSNLDPLGGLPGFLQPHLGDGCYCNGKLYVVAENYPDVSNQQILVFDARTLERLRAIPTLQTHEVAGVTAVQQEGEHGVLYLASYFDSTRLFKYDVADGSYLGDMPLNPAPRIGIQGISYNDGQLYLSVGRVHNVGYVYSASLEGTTTLRYMRRTIGFHEGIDFDGDHLLWLIDRSNAPARVCYLSLPKF